MMRCAYCNAELLTCSTDADGDPCCPTGVGCAATMLSRAEAKAKAIANGVKPNTFGRRVQRGISLADASARPARVYARSGPRVQWLKNPPIVEWHGESLTVFELAHRHSVSDSLCKLRMRSGWVPVLAATLPCARGGRRVLGQLMGRSTEDQSSAVRTGSH